jgi:hypothetical protein
MPARKITIAARDRLKLIFVANMSVVYYKFKAAKDQDFDVYTFDGSGTSVFDLKREIIRAKKLGKGTDFDLAIYNSQSNEGKRLEIVHYRFCLQPPHQ